MRSTALTTWFFIFTLIVFSTSIFSCGKPPEGTVVTISLPKKTYKMYEPIELQYEWINYKDTPDSIRAIFSSPVYIKQFITDSDEGTFDKKFREPDAFYVLIHIVAKGDTLKRTIALNNYGKGYVSNIIKEGSYFHSEYFPPGKYKVYSVIEGDVNKQYTVPIKTNEVVFEVVELNDEDKAILELARKERYEEAMQLYPDNYFEEHLMYFNILNYNRSFFTAGEMNNRFKDTSSLSSRYKIFFDKYPASPYNLQPMFMVYYLRVNSRDSAEANARMNELLEKYPETTISKTVRDILKMEKLTGRSIIYLRGYHIKYGESEEVKPAPPKEK